MIFLLKNCDTDPSLAKGNSDLLKSLAKGPFNSLVISILRTLGS
jgi:hypothetical protein